MCRLTRIAITSFNVSFFSEDKFSIFIRIGNTSRLAKNLTSAVQETGVSRHNGGQLKPPLKPLNTIEECCHNPREGFPSSIGPLLRDAERRQWLGCSFSVCRTQRFFFEILLNQTEIRFYLPISDWFGTQQTDSVRLLFQFNRFMVNTIWFRFDSIRFSKRFHSLPRHAHPGQLWLINWLAVGTVFEGFANSLRLWNFPSFYESGKTPPVSAGKTTPIFFYLLYSCRRDSR